MFSGIAGAQLMITSNPVSAHVYVGGSVTFQVTASGNTGPINYTWLKDFMPIGGNSPTLTIDPVTMADHGSYSCSVSDDVDTVVSSSALLEANDPLLITSQPQSATVQEGQAFILSVVVLGGYAPFTYQWRKDGVQITDATNDSLTLAAVAQSDAGAYSCEILDSNTMAVMSDLATLTVEAVFPFAITVQPQSATVSAGDNYTFSVGAENGTPPLGYAWYKDGLPVGADNTILSLTNVTMADAGDYHCEITDGDSNTLVSEIATLTVQPASTFLITLHPQSAMLTVGENYTLSVAVEGGTPPYNYTWHKDSAIVGANSSELALTALTVADSGNYTCEIADSGSEVLSTNVATLAVSEPLLITTQPQSATLTEGASFTLTIGITGGNPPYSYLWFKDSDAILTATDATYNIAAVTLADAGQYRCYVSDSTIHAEFSNNATLDVQPDSPPLTIEINPIGATVNVGQSCSFSVAASGGVGALTYTWFKDGAAMGAHQPTLTIGYVTPADAGSYWCLIEDEADGSVTSDTALLTVEQNGDTVPPAITLNGANPLVLMQNSPYTELGATAEDDVDGNITEDIIISGEVDTTAVGVGEILYVVSDAAGNTTSRARLIFVDPIEPVTQEIDEEGGNIWVPGVTLDIPPGAILEPATVSLVRADVPPLSAPLNIAVAGAAGCYSIGGLSGAVAPVIFTFYYADTDDDGIVDGTNCPETDLVLIIVDRNGTIHILRGEVAAAANTLTVTIPTELLPNLKGPDDIYAILGYENGVTVPLQPLPILVVLMTAGLLRLRRRK